MQISYTEDGYLKVNVEKNEEIDYEQIQRMNTTPYLMPSLRDRYEDNSVLYYKGEYITIADFIKGKVFSFVDFQNLLVSLLQVYAKLEKDGYIISNTCVSLDRVFIHPVKKTVYLVYVPLKGEMILPKDRLSELLHELIFGIQTNDSAILLGILLEASNKDNISLDKLITEVKNVKEQNFDMQSHVIEKEIEVPVEKIIIKDGKCKMFGVIAMLTEALTGILLPIVIGGVVGTKMVNVQLCIVVGVFNIIVYMISMIALNHNKIQVVNGNVMVNAQETRNGNGINKNEVIKNQPSEKQQEIFKIKEEHQITYENNPARVKRKIGMQSIQENNVSAHRGMNSQNRIENVKNSKNMVIQNDNANLHDKMIDFAQEEGNCDII